MLGQMLCKLIARYAVISYMTLTKIISWLNRIIIPTALSYLRDECTYKTLCTVLQPTESNIYMAAVTTVVIVMLSLLLSLSDPEEATCSNFSNCLRVSVTFYFRHSVFHPVWTAPVSYQIMSLSKLIRNILSLDSTQ